MNSNDRQLIESVFAGSGEIATHLRELDWSATPLGPVEQWPQALRTIVRVVLGSGYPMAICWGPDYVLLYNEAYRPIAGTRHPWALGRGAREVYPEAWDFIGPMYESVMARGQAANFLSDVLVPLSRNNYLEEVYFAFSASPLPDDSGRVGGVLNSALETTERVIEDRRRHLLRDLASRAAGARTEEEVWRVSAEILGENCISLPFAFLYEYRPSEHQAYLAGASVETGDALHPAVIDCRSENLWRLDPGLAREAVLIKLGDLASGVSVPNWPERPKEAIVVPIRLGEHGDAAGFLVAGIHPGQAFGDAYRQFVQRVVEQIAIGLASARAYEQERQRAEALAELDRAKTTFFSNVSHEFRTPLTLMLGPLEEVLAHERLEPEGHEQLVTVRRNGIRLLKLVNTLLDFSRIEAGRVQASYQPTDLAGFTTEIASAFDSAMKIAGLRFSVECQPIADPAYVDRDMWEKIVLNLLSNAYKFTFTGEVVLTLQPIDGAVELKVRDTGVGIPEKHLEHVFERFHRIESTQARTYEGTGIGLALVEELVRLHGGSVRVESAVGSGSTFTVTILSGKEHLPAERIHAPQSLVSTTIRAEAYVEELQQWLENEPEVANNAARPPKLASPAPSSEPSPDAKRESIVVADDNADMRQYLTRLLSKLYEVHAVGDGRLALEATQQLRPALVLADVMMPHLDGFGLLQAIREDSALAGTPVVLVSARAGEESRVEGLDADADDYLIKPFAARELLARVAAHVKMSNLRRETAEREERMRSEAELEREKQRASEERWAETSRLYGELQQADEELQLQVELLQQLPVSAWTLNPDGTPDFVNRVWLEFAGQTLDFIRSHPEAWMTAFHPEDREMAARAFWKGVNSGQGFAFETRSLRAQDGTYRWHLQQAVVLRDAEGKVLKFVGTTTDIDDQKRTVGELRASEANLRRVIDTIPSLSWCNLPDGPNEFLSKGWHDYTGMSPEEAHGWGWSASFHPDDLPPLMNRWQELLVSGEPGEIEARIRRHDGEYRWFLIRVAPFHDESGAILRWYGTSTDIHDRKLADEALRTSENNLRQILDSIPGLVCTMDPTGEIQHLNRPLLDYFGKTPEELKGWKMTDAVHPDDLPEVIESYTHSITTGAPYEIEHRCRRVDGVYRWFQVRASAVRNADGHITGWYVLLTDIEDRKRAEDALRASETNLREILDSIPGLVCTLSPAGEMEVTNRPFLQYFGKTLDELKDWGNSDAVHPDDLPGVVLEFTDSITTGAPYYTEHRCRRADGVYRWFQNSARPVRDTEGRITRWYCLITDIDDRKRAENELKRSEARHRVVVETASDAVVSIDESGAIILANPATKRIFGYSPEELIGKPLTVLMPGAMRKLHETGFNRYLETGARHLNWQGSEVTAMRASGEEFPAEVSFGEMVSNDRKIFTGFIRDISEKKRAQEAILASERKLSLIINTMPVLAWSALPDGAVEFFNQRWLDYTGLLPEQAQGWGWAEAFHHDDLGRVTEYWQSMIASGRPGETEARFRRFDGEYRWFLFRADPMRDESGAIVKWYGTNTDIDRRKRAEEALRIRELNLLQITETIPEMLWSASPGGAIEYCNGRLLDYTGISPEQILSDGRMNFLHPDDVEPTAEVWKSCVKSGTPYKVEVRAFHAADRTYRWCMTSALPLLDKEGHIVKWHGTVVDMHDWKKAQEELRNTQAELARVMRVLTIGQLTASIAHEVNQPLSGIITNASTCLRMLKSDPPNIDGARETAQRAIRDGNRASEVITRLRTLFSKKQTEFEPLDLNESAREVIALLSSELQRNDVVLKQDFSDRLPAVKGDRVQLQQVILNLIHNASDAMVTVNDRPRQLLIKTETHANHVTVSVQDSGVGFSPEISERLFEPFLTTKQGGMGIGLSVSRSIVEAHQGRLWAAQNAGPGATFTFSIPQDAGNLPDQ